MSYLDRLAQEVAAGRPAAVAKVVGWSPGAASRVSADAAPPARPSAVSPGYPSPASTAWPGTVSPGYPVPPSPAWPGTVSPGYPGPASPARLGTASSPGPASPASLVAATPAPLGAAVVVGTGGILHADAVLQSPAPGGGPALAAAMVELAAEMLDRGETGCRWLRLPEGDVRVYVEAHLPPPVLLVVGGGHVGQQVAAAGSLAGFEVWVLDDRPSFASPSRFPTARRVICGPLLAELAALAPGPRHHVVLVTRGHTQDRACLSALAGAPVAYLGMIGSRTRVRAVRDALLAGGAPEEWLERVRAPIGLDIGARTPGEIAIAVVAEVIAARRGGTGAPLSALDRPLVHLSRR